MGLDREIEPGVAVPGGGLDALSQHLDVELGQHLQQALLLLLAEIDRLDHVRHALELYAPQLAPILDQLADLLQPGDRDLGLHDSLLRAARTRRARSSTSSRPVSSPDSRSSAARRSSIGSSTR